MLSRSNLPVALCAVACTVLISAPGCESTKRTSKNTVAPSVKSASSESASVAASETDPAETNSRSSADTPAAPSGPHFSAAPARTAAPATPNDTHEIPAPDASEGMVSTDEATLVAGAVKPEPPMAKPGEIVSPEGEVLFVRQKPRPGSSVIMEQWTEKMQPDGTFVKHGPWARWFDNGNPYLKGEYLDGKEHGMLYSWHKNGQLRGVGQFIFGDKVGKWIKWDDTGRKRNEYHFKNNMLNGPWTEWDESGEIVSSGNYVDERKDGLWTETGDDGVRTQRTWRLGVPQS